MAKIKLGDGKTIKDGDEVTLVLWSAEHRNAETGEPETIEKTAHGVVHSIDVVEPVYEDDPDFGRIITGKNSVTHWELLTGNPDYPAIGFLPENVKTKTGK
jgi:hypothetical protein